MKRMNIIMMLAAAMLFASSCCGNRSCADKCKDKCGECCEKCEKQECKKECCKPECKKHECKKGECKKGECKKGECKKGGCRQECQCPKSAVFVMDAENPSVDAGAGATRKMLGFDKDLMLVKVTLDASRIGSPLKLHDHPHCQVTYVISGKYEAHIGDEVKVIAAGDSYYVAPGVPHGVIVIEPGDLIDAFSPMRKDFLK